jgi:hypothetical protein
VAWVGVKVANRQITYGGERVRGEQAPDQRHGLTTLGASQGGQRGGYRGGWRRVGGRELGEARQQAVRLRQPSPIATRQQTKVADFDFGVSSVERQSP